MASGDPEGFSANNTSVERTAGSGTVVKRVSPNATTGLSLESLAALIGEYAELLRGAGVSVPAVHSASVGSASIDYVLDDTGPNLVQTFPDAGGLLTDEKVLARVVATIEAARRAGVALDPHPKNFTVTPHGEVHFVDLTPPLVPAYVARRIASAGVEDAALLLANFAAFEPAYSGYHFIADFLSIGAPYAEHVEQVGEVFMDAGLIERDQRLLRAMAVRIRAVEDERLRRGLFLF